MNASDRGGRSDIVRHESAEPTYLKQRDEENVEIHLLGGFRVSRGASVAGDSSWRLKKARSVVKLLALAHGHQLPRDTLLDLLWPDLEPRAAANNFHRALHFARRALSDIATGNDTFLTLHDHLLTLAPTGSVRIDVDRFEAAATSALRSNNPARYQAAIDLYRGDLLPEDRYEDWAGGRRTALRETYLALLLHLAQMEEQRGHIPAAQSVFQQLLENEPAHEDAHDGLMRLFARTGQRHQALRQYDHLVDVLQRDLDSQPSAASQRLYRDIVEERFPVQPVVRPVEAPYAGHGAQTNLPASITSFVGRADERRTVTELVNTHRLVTITGPGGSGKTRLALEVAADLTSNFPDGVWLVELAHLSDSGLLPRVVIAALGVQAMPEQAMLTTLQRFLAQRHLLLVLDNCEHLIEASADLAHRLVHTCPRLHMLTTSRETLRVAGEATWSIPPLATPDPSSLPPLADLLGIEAVQLFLDRARERYPGFIINEQAAQSVAQICHRLEGIPLAIELAAARARTLSVEQMAGRLDDVLRLLNYGPRTGPRRQQSLESTIDWSYQLLPDAERKVFRRLSVFAGGCTLSAAEAVCSDGSPSAGTVLNILDNLVDKSLVMVDRHSDTPRYRLLEPIRQFAGERLQQSRGTETTRRRHVAWCLAFTTVAESQIWTAEQTVWVRRVEVEQDNVRAALAWCMEHDVETGLELAGNLWWFWRMRGDFWEGRRWLESILERTSKRTSVEARALLADGTLAAIQGDFEWARPRIEKSLAIFRAVGDQRFIGWATVNLGYLDLHNHKLDTAEPLLQGGLALLQTAGDQRGIGWTLDALGDVVADRGDFVGALRFYKQRLDMHREMGDERGISWALLKMANIARIEGDASGARLLLEESLILSREVGDKWATSWALNCLGMTALSENDHQQARASLDEGLRIFQAIGDHPGCVYSLFCFGLLLLREGDYAGGIGAIQAAESQPPPLGVWLTAQQRADCETAVADARATVGNATFNEIEYETRSMTFDQAINYVLVSAPAELEHPL